MRRMVRFVALVVALSTVGSQAAAETTQEVVNKAPNGLALTPPMGWNSWNKFACDVNEQTVRATADAMVAVGMRDAGYQYVVIDDCWHGPRDANGFITADTQKFPSGIKALADYVHSRGLKFGIYSDAGRLTCGGRPGSQGHEYQDAITYARWGVDYLKYDWCSTGDRNAKEAYAVMADALRQSGRPIVFSMCEWGTAKPWVWAKNTGNLWRTTGDIFDSFDTKDRSADWAHPVTRDRRPERAAVVVCRTGPLERSRHAGGRQWRHDASGISFAFLALGDDGGAADCRQRHRQHGRDDALDPPERRRDRGRSGQAGCARAPRREGWNERSLGEAATGGAVAVLLFNRGEQPATISATARQIGLPSAAACGRGTYGRTATFIFAMARSRQRSNRMALLCSGSG